MKIFLGVLFIIIFTHNVLPAKIIINEVQSSNTNTIVDDDGETSDWFELYNDGDEEVNILNYTIEDKIGLENRWKFPNITLKPKQHLLVFASGKDRYENNYHQINTIGYNYGYWRWEGDYRFDYIEVGEYAEFSVRINSFNFINEISETGVLFAEDLEKRTRFCNISIRNDDYFHIGINHKVVENQGLNWYGSYVKEIDYDFPNVWLKIRKKKNIIETYISSIPDCWFLVSIDTFDFGENSGFIGIASASGDENRVTQGVYSDLKINGELSNFSVLKIKNYHSNKVDLNYKTIFYHTNFSLDAEFDKLTLRDSKGKVIDSLIINKIPSDVSISRNAEKQIILFMEPTPGTLNVKDSYKEYIHEKRLSIQGGIYQIPVLIAFMGIENDEKVYYTTNSSTPTINSTLWDNNHILIDKTTVLRYFVFSGHKIPSEVFTETYIINDFSNLPTISLVSDSSNFFDDEIGIWAFGKNADTLPPYNGANFWENWEIPLNLEYYEEDKTALNLKVGAQNHGRFSRYIPQKSLRLYSRNEYDMRRIRNLFFEKGINDLKRIVLKTGGQDWEETLLNDNFAEVLAIQSDNVDYLGIKFVRAYINGDYWGIYQVKEKNDKYYFENNFNTELDEIYLLKGLDYVQLGGYCSIHDFIEKLKDSDKGIIKRDSLILENIDYNNFMDYMILNTFLVNKDWDLNNNKFWKSVKPNSKWRWIATDLEVIMSMHQINFNFFEYIDQYDTNIFFAPFSHTIMKRVYQSDTLSNLFITRYADLLNTILLPENTHNIIDSLANIIRQEVPRHQERWKESIPNWEENINSLKQFTTDRSRRIWYQLRDFFKIGEVIDVRIQSNIPNSCEFKINSLPLMSDFSGKYFSNFPMNISVYPKKGYKFRGWMQDTTSNNVIVFSPNYDKYELIATFEDESDTLASNSIIINEIMYKSPDNKDTKDWIELYNNSNNIIDISDWVLKDSDDDHIYVIDKNTTIKPDNYLVLIYDKSEFTSFYPDIQNYQGSFDFGLGRGDIIRLFDKSGSLMDFVEYKTISPWPAAADGKGPSLELNNPNSDNNNGLNWNASFVELGTPGRKNSSINSITKVSNSVYVFPNPTKDKIWIVPTNKVINLIDIKLFDTFGSLIYLEPLKSANADANEIMIDISKELKGLYFLQINYLDENGRFQTSFIKIMKV